MTNFDVATFIDQCVHAVETTDDPVKAITKIVTAALRDPIAVEKELPIQGEDKLLLHHCDKLTIYRVLVYHGLQYPPHDHGVPVVIGAYSGYATNVLYARTPADPTRIQSIGLLNMHAGQVRTLRAEAIHAVTNGRAQPSAAIHVYVGDLHAQKCSLWTLEGEGECEFEINEYNKRARRLAMSIVA
jgi:predicted metal-dependent enzyme (double-stranded beta helix superfamily)